MLNKVFLVSQDCQLPQAPFCGSSRGSAYQGVSIFGIAVVIEKVLARPYPFFNPRAPHECFQGVSHARLTLHDILPMFCIL